MILGGNNEADKGIVRIQGNDLQPGAAGFEGNVLRVRPGVFVDVFESFVSVMRIYSCVFCNYAKRY